MEKTGPQKKELIIRKAKKEADYIRELGYPLDIMLGLEYNENKMKKEIQKKIRRDVYGYTWGKYKNEHTMQELVDNVFNGPSLATFFRAVKNMDYQLKVIEKGLNKLKKDLK